MTERLPDPLPESSNGDLDAISQVAWEQSRAKLLDCLAESISSAKGWPMVTVTALRETTKEVTIDVVTNGGFADGETQTYSYRTTADGALEYRPDNVHYDYFRAIEAYMKDIADEWHGRASPGRDGQDWTSLSEHNPETFQYKAFIRQLPRIKIYCVDLYHELWNLKVKSWNAIHQELKNQTSSFLDHVADADYVFKSDEDPKRLTTESAHTDTSIMVEYLRKAVTFAFASTRDDELWNALDKVLILKTAKKILRLCRYVARPLRACLMLQTIAKRLPKDKTFKLVPRVPPPSVRLGVTVPSIDQAWERLRLPRPAQWAKENLMNKYGKIFREECRRPLSIHTELQLLAAYLQDPSLQPTFNYFGCSKKACLLCQTTLDLSSLGIRMRGTHGKCYSNWGVPAASIARMAPTLEALEKVLLQRIRASLQPGSRYFEHVEADSTLLSEMTE
ncbi:hypothetical protein PRZ48_005586 [Zasmidium cellare]|uniref:Uncharacterized protein n=1 Tax=Zasmidium cellare TaxID=395010 RepID=A0ABR0EKX9_ZASCE|nr:hypothetical protein PRZ48_005586 [Zasmidium cellare]